MSGHSLVPLRDLILESQNGLSKRSGADGAETPVLRLANITAGCIDESDPREIRLTAKELAKYALQHGDLVCIRVNGSKALVGRVIQFRANRVWAYCDHFIRLRPNQVLVDHRYLAHYFNSQTVRRHVELNMVSSAGQNTVSQGTMLDILVPCPALETQREIVAELEKQFSRLDEAVANLQRVKANLKRYKASVLKAAVEGRLVETEATLARREGRTYETGEQLLQRILKERRAKWSGRGAFSAEAPSESLAVVPEGWAAASVDQLATVVRGGSPRPAGDTRYFGGIVPWITVGSITADETDYLRHANGGLTEAGKERSRFIEEHTLLLTNSGATLGVPKISMIAGCINDGVAALLDVDYPLKQYLVHYLRTKTDALRQVNQGAAQPNLNTTIIKAMVVPLPPVAEQARILAEVDRHLSIIREVEAEVDSNLQRAQALRQATLSKAFQQHSEKRVGR